MIYVSGRLTWSPTRVDLTNQKRLLPNAHAQLCHFSGSPAMARNVEVKQRQHFYHHGDTIWHPKSGYVTTKLHRTSTCRRNNNAICSDSYFHVSCRLRMPATLIWPRRNLGSSCQTGNTAGLLNSLFVVLKFRFCLSIVSYIMIIL